MSPRSIASLAESPDVADRRDDTDVDRLEG
jgi:hypothetical protein